MKGIFLLLCFCAITGINLSGAPLKKIFNNRDTTYHIIAAPSNTYGYEILVKNKTLIKQLSIPGKPGIKGFLKKQDAEKVARLVILKLSKGIMPPTINEKELNKLKIKL
jgi:hypothetical protein